MEPETTYEMTFYGTVVEHIKIGDQVISFNHKMGTLTYLEAVLCFIEQEQRKLTTHEENLGENID